MSITPTEFELFCEEIIDYTVDRYNYDPDIDYLLQSESVKTQFQDGVSPLTIGDDLYIGHVLS